MIEKLNYISDDELERLINQVEQEELVVAPPDLMESILEAAGLVGEPAKVTEISAVTRKKEFHAYCFRVITSVAAAIALVFLLPELTKGMNINGAESQKHPEKSEVVQTVPSKNEVVTVKMVPSKEEVLNDAGFIEKVISSTAEWFNKENKDD